MKITTRFTPDENLVVTEINGRSLDPPIMIVKGQPVSISLAGHFPPGTVAIEIAGYKLRPIEE